MSSQETQSEHSKSPGNSSNDPYADKMLKATERSAEGTHRGAFHTKIGWMVGLLSVGVAVITTVMGIKSKDALEKEQDGIANERIKYQSDVGELNVKLAEAKGVIADLSVKTQELAALKIENEKLRQRMELTAFHAPTDPNSADDPAAPSGQPPPGFPKEFSDLQQMLRGKSANEVAQILGKPDITSGDPARGEMWIYHRSRNLVKDKVRGANLGLSIMFIRNSARTISIQSF